MRRVFLLSPASLSGERARLLLRPQARFALALRLRAGEATLGEVMTFLSGLYFRGKLAYAGAFARETSGRPDVFVITAGAGLVPPSVRVSLGQLLEMAEVPIDPREPRFLEPLVRDAAKVDAVFSRRCLAVLLGSIATRKYLAPLLPVFGERLVFPRAFVGRGDMSRGGLLLRCVDEGRELDYVPVGRALRHGPRPPKLAPRGSRGRNG